LSAFTVSQRDRILLAETGEMLAKTVPDQVAVSGIAGNGAVVSFQVRGGVTRGTHFLFEIYGEDGDLVLAPTTRNSRQRQTLVLRGGGGGGAPLAGLPVPANTAGCRRACRPKTRTMSRSSTGDWLKASKAAGLPTPNLVPPSAAIACSMRLCAPR